ncbi:MAG TPA: ABC transporter substrate-binding protein [Acetobacteraceae bacterium]|nr:ABC transporter substrate-binding protein [Acetobacteraceae bacterium]
MPRLTRRRFAQLAATAGLTGATRPDKLTVLLDWFVNPDHAPILVAQESGAFARQNLIVDLIAPADATMPPKLVAAGHGDIALTDQPHFHEQVAGGLPLVRIGALIDRPLATLVALQQSGITSIHSLKGKRIGHGAGDAEQAMVGAMLATAGLKLADVQMVDVGEQLTVALLIGQVDAVTVYRNFELLELRGMGEPVSFDYEKNGVPWYDEMIFVTSAALAGDRRLPRFLAAVREGAARLRIDPEDAWQRCAAARPDLKTSLNRAAWQVTIPYFAADPFAVDMARYATFAAFLARSGVITPPPPVGSYVRLLSPD